MYETRIFTEKDNIVTHTGTIIISRMDFEGRRDSKKVIDMLFKIKDINDYESIKISVKGIDLFTSFPAGKDIFSWKLIKSIREIFNNKIYFARYSDILSKYYIHNNEIDDFIIYDYGINIIGSIVKNSKIINFDKSSETSFGRTIVLNKTLDQTSSFLYLCRDIYFLVGEYPKNFKECMDSYRKHDNLRQATQPIIWGIMKNLITLVNTTGIKTIIFPQEIFKDKMLDQVRWQALFYKYGVEEKVAENIKISYLNIEFEQLVKYFGMLNNEYLKEINQGDIDENFIDL